VDRRVLRVGISPWQTPPYASHRPCNATPKGNPSAA
jgi:hypothetical protein